MTDEETEAAVVKNLRWREGWDEILKRHPALVEELAKLQHEQWSAWQQYLHSRCIKQHIFFEPNGNLIIPKVDVERWAKQMDTPYADLPETEKAGYRWTVERFLPGIFYALGVKP